MTATTADVPAMTTDATPSFDGATFRRALGHVPTSVCIVTLSDELGDAGMTVGSFTSISLEPPLVGFFVDARSSTLTRLRTASRMTVNLLNDAQGELCYRFAKPSDDRFAGVDLVPGDHPAPRFAESVAWIDCAVDQMVTVGDHELIVGRVLDFEVPSWPRRPLVFFRGVLSQLDARTVPSASSWSRDHYGDEW
ncbi:flavin reductase family protein [Knoellia sp. CPCC 206453]|uniref:flavin reductase family protein n=1 Tax=Knoellia pratensis TaxID=3404796 RepID=UPI00361CA4BE